MFKTFFRAQISSICLFDFDAEKKYVSQNTFFAPDIVLCQILREVPYV
jgi:hypothetical protein